MDISADNILQDIKRLSARRPIIHNVTNYVAMTPSANVLLAIGASPLMAHADEELKEIARLSQALVINIGTLDASWLRSMELAQQHAKQHDIPTVLDPVGAGASQLRTTTALSFLSSGVDVVRGNANEIIALANEDIVSAGVDATCTTDKAISAAKKIALQYGCIVAVTGVVDIVVSAGMTTYLKHGHVFLSQVTAMGCALSAVVGAFLTIRDDTRLATCHAILAFTIASENAAKISNGPGTFYPNFIDQLSLLQDTSFSRLSYSNE